MPESVRRWREHMFVPERRNSEPPIPLLKHAGRPPAEGSTAEFRYCRRHGQVVFHRYSEGTRGHRWRCKRCVGEAVTRRHQKVKRILVAEAGGCCAVCGYARCVVNLHFHHVDPAQKAFAVTVASGKSLDAYRAEAQKCVLVCANCHGEIEAGLIPSPAPQARFKAA
jgi:5-methylcytosine-specific restriction endonuclease McrA